MRKKPTESGGMLSDMNTGLSFFLLVARAHSLCLVPFMRDGFGMEAFGLTALLSCFMMLIYADYSLAPEMFTFFLLWLFVVMIQWARAGGADRRGELVHSRYLGWPCLAMRLPLVRSETTAKRFVEPLICLAVGRLLCFISIPIGHFVMAGCVSLAFASGIQHQFWRARVRRMRDAQIEQQQLAEMFNQSNRNF